MKIKNKFTLKETRFGIQMYKGRERKFLKSILVILVYLLLILTIAITAINVMNTIQSSLNNISVKQCNELNSTWLGSVASYWGGVIGGIVSGSLSVIGVFLTIRHYKNSDAKKDRIKHLPFLELNILERKHINGVSLSKAYYIEGTNNRNDNNSKLFLLNIKIENIGSGFAKTLVLQTNENIGGVECSRLIKVNDTTDLQIEFYSNNVGESGLTFGIIYIDCMSNEYQQMYTIKFRKQNYYIESGYPIFLGQVHDIADT